MLQHKPESISTLSSSSLKEKALKIETVELAEQPTVTIRDLYSMLARIIEKHGDMEVSLMVGPDWEDAPLQSALFNPEHGGLFLMGNVIEEDDDLDLDDVVDALEATIVPKAPPKEMVPPEAEEA